MANLRMLRQAMMAAAAGLALCGMAAIAFPAEQFTVLHRFSGTDGELPASPLVQAFGGKIYGTTVLGGTHGLGTVFTITPAGVLTTVHSFGGLDGASGPGGAFVQAADGNFYGTASGGYGFGTVIKVTPGGVVTTLYKFCPQVPCTDGKDPSSGLVQGSDGNFYGVTALGGMSDNGTVFKISSSGVLTTLHRFDGSDGSGPRGTLIQASDGNFYGTTQLGGTSQNGRGTVFKITASGVLTTLHSFNSGDDGSDPFAGLVQAGDGTLYGTTSSAGLNVSGCGSGCGTIFQVTRQGVLTTLHEFDLADGRNPEAPLVQASDANFYGATLGGGANDSGTLFRLTADGHFASLYSFCSQSNCADGNQPLTALLQDTNGIFYGTANQGGTSNEGTVYSLNVGLKPFVKPQLAFGPVGATVIILGTNLTGATSVTFGGTNANFTVVSQSEITATVPTGANNGKIKVVTPHGTLLSNPRFKVLP